MAMGCELNVIVEVDDDERRKLCQRTTTGFLPNNKKIEIQTKME
jgi:hypothetical protein